MVTAFKVLLVSQVNLCLHAVSLSQQMSLFLCVHLDQFPVVYIMHPWISSYLKKLYGLLWKDLFSSYGSIFGCFGDYYFVASIPSRGFFEDILWGICVPENKSCHGGLLRRSTEADVLHFEIWEANKGKEAGIVMSHAGGSFRESYFPGIWWIIPGRNGLIQWVIRIFPICAAVEWVASWTTRLVDYWLPLK